MLISRVVGIIPHSTIFQMFDQINTFPSINKEIKTFEKSTIKVKELQHIAIKKRKWSLKDRNRPTALTLINWQAIIVQKRVQHLPPRRNHNQYIEIFSLLFISSFIFRWKIRKKNSKHKIHEKKWNKIKWSFLQFI